ncbi:MAG: hypothetical protein BroJett030_21370 [Alphaproteobacteria bacterium]|nr:MAG: hypothetical protein BroJett030_21370 [Alphaproteobacteria bacterium]
MRRRDDDMNPRTCIVTREARAADELIRFVADPGGRVVADLARALPGRGVWVIARRAMVDRAVARRLFARGLRADVVAGEQLGAEVDALMEKRALEALSLANKAGLVRTGAVKVDKALGAGGVALVLEATDGAEDGMRKIAAAVRAAMAAGRGPIVTKRVFTSMQMGLALGGHNVIHAAAIGGGATARLIERIEWLERYRG